MLLRGTTRLTPASRCLEWAEVPAPRPGPDELLLRVQVCGVCHTELDEIEGRTPPPAWPVVPGHQVVGTVVAAGSDGLRGWIGTRVGVAWIHSSCGRCRFCRAGLENLCPGFRATGRDADGGYAEFMTVPAGSAHPLPESMDDSAAAPLLCAGAVGFRALRLCRLTDGDTIGLAGFGASGHLVLQAIRALLPHSRILVFARSGQARTFAEELGAAWAGRFEDTPAEPPAAIIDTTPAWRPVLASLGHLQPGGRLVINAIRKESTDQEALQQLDYARHLWMEKEIKTVANVTVADVRDFLQLAARHGIRPRVRERPLAEANEAILDLRFGHPHGALVLRVARG